MLATDGRASFAIFIYADTIELQLVSRLSTTGFNAGDRTRAADFVTASLNTINVFRIDGMCISDLCKCDYMITICGYSAEGG